MNYTQDGLNNKAIAELNPFRYRGYYYDAETNLYYLNSRYYDPETCRFINTDDFSVLAEGKDILNGLNLYIYCNNNPINDIDENGNWSWGNFFKIFAAVAVTIVSVLAGIATFGVSATLIMAGIGMAINVTSYTISTAVTGGDFTIGGFVGATLGGIFGGVLSLTGLGSFAVGFWSGAFTSISSDLIDDVAYNKQTNYLQLVGKGLIDGFMAGTISGLMGSIKIKGLNAGRGSFKQVSAQLMTKFKLGLISKISMKSFFKIFAVEAFNEVGDFLFSLIQGLLKV